MSTAYFVFVFYIPSLDDCNKLSNPPKISGPNPWVLRMLLYLGGGEVPTDVIKYLYVGRLAWITLWVLNVITYTHVWGRQKETVKQKRKS